MNYLTATLYFIGIPMLITHMILRYFGLKCLNRLYKREPDKFQWGYYNLYEVAKWTINWIPIIGWYFAGNCIIDELKLQLKMWMVRRLLKKVATSLRKRGNPEDAATLDNIRAEVRSYAGLKDLQEVLKEANDDNERTGSDSGSLPDK